MQPNQSTPCTAFEGVRAIAAGSLAQVAEQVKRFLAQNQEVSILIFDDESGETIELDMRGSVADVLARLAPATPTPPAEPPDKPAAPRGPGRPKLGVVSREVTLLPRHWDWLAGQPGGASVTLRKLVEQARKVNQGRDQMRHAQEAAYKFMSAMAGDLPGFEEATRALFAGDVKRFQNLVDPWPRDIASFAMKLSQGAFPAPGKVGSAK